MSPALHHVITSQIKSSQHNPNGKRYNDHDKIFALNLYSKSPSAYHLSGTLQVPSKSSTHSWLSNNNYGPGFDDYTVNAIKCKMSNISKAARTCVMLVDEMSFKSNMQYSISRDEIVCFEDYGNGDITSKIATSAIVFMLRVIRKKWKQPFVFS